MIFYENTPTTTKTIQDQTFEFPQPFTLEMFEYKKFKEMNLDPEALAEQNNAQLLKNLEKLLAAEIRGVLRANKKLEDGQDSQPLPDQSALDEIINSYTGAFKQVTAFDKAFIKHANTAVKTLLREYGYANDEKTLQKPVTVAKKDTAPAENQISREEFIAEVKQLVNGEGKWLPIDEGGSEAFTTYRNQLVGAVQSEIEANEKAAALATATLGS